MASTPEITERIQVIVQRYENGNVSAFARRIGLSQRGASKVFHGETSSPGFNILSAICRKYPVDPTWLITGKTNKQWAGGEERVKTEAYRIAVDMIRMYADVLEAPEGMSAELAKMVKTAETPEMQRAARGMLALASQIKRTG